MLDLDDIQHILLTRTPALTGRYEFLSFAEPTGGRAWLSELIDRVDSAAAAMSSMDSSDRWITLAFTWNGLRALGLGEDSLATFPDEFREGMAARADILGDTGRNAPEHWVGGLAEDRLHAIAILFARNETEYRRCISEHDKLLARCPGVKSLSFLDLNATPPFNYAHDHFGFRDRLSQPAIKGSGEEPTPGSGDSLEPGEFILGYPDEFDPAPTIPQPNMLARNGIPTSHRCQDPVRHPLVVRRNSSARILRIVVGEPNVVVRGKEQARSFPHQPLAHRGDLLGRGQARRP